MQYNGNICEAVSVIREELQSDMIEDILEDRCNETAGIFEIPYINYIHDLIAQMYKGIDSKSVQIIYDKLEEELRIERYFDKFRLDRFRAEPTRNASGSCVKIISNDTVSFEEKEYLLFKYNRDKDAFIVIRKKNECLSMSIYEEIGKFCITDDMLEINFLDSSTFIFKI